MAKKPRFPAIKSHDFNGRTWKIVWRAPKRDKNCPPGHMYFGHCDHNRTKLYIYPSSDPLELLDTVLDESTHAYFYDLDNDAVRDYVTELMGLFKRMGIKVTFDVKSD